MQQIKNGFKPCYYLTEDGKVFNKERNKYLACNRYFYQLQTETGKTKGISLKKLYRIVYKKEYCIDNIQLLDGEEFREITGTAGMYFVSNKGRIKSYYDYEAIILKPTNVNGYPRVDILYKGVRKTKLISRLVAAEWLPQPPTIDCQLHHKDHNRENAAIDNLVWLSQEEHFKLHKEQRTCQKTEKQQAIQTKE